MNRSITFVLLIFLGIGLSSCHYSSTPSSLPLAVEQHLNSLSSMDQPVKVMIDTVSHRVYWLSFTGEIYGMSFTSDYPERIVGGVGVGQSALFIQDFCVDALNNRIVFTDLRDSRTGHSAIKQISLSSMQVSTLVGLSGETPYQVGINPRTRQVCYLTKESKGEPPIYRLRALHQKEALLVSFTKIYALPGAGETAAPTKEMLAYRQK